MIKAPNLRLLNSLTYAFLLFIVSARQQFGGGSEAAAGRDAAEGRRGESYPDAEGGARVSEEHPLGSERGLCNDLYGI